MNKLLLVAILLSLSLTVLADGKPKKKKSVVDMTEAELEKIYEQWEADEEKLPDDELPPYQRRPPPISLEDIKKRGPDGVKAMSKRGKALMMFVTVSGDPTEQETEEITALWQSSLFNANLQLTRYIMERDKAIFMVDDGATAFEIKDFLIKQERCLEVKIDNEIFKGVYHDEKKDVKKEMKRSPPKKLQIKPVDDEDDEL